MKTIDVKNMVSGKFLKNNFISMLMLFFTTYGFSNEINISISKESKYYYEMVKAGFDNYEVNVTYSKINIKKVNLIDDHTYQIENVKSRKRFLSSTRETSFFLQKTKDENIKRIKIKLIDEDDNEFYVNFLFYCKAIYLDSFKNVIDLTYDIEEGYPPYIYVKSLQVGNFIFFNESKSIDFKFDLLLEFQFIVNKLKKGTYFLSENSYDNLILRLHIK